MSVPSVGTRDRSDVAFSRLVLRKIHAPANPASMIMDPRNQANARGMSRTGTPPQVDFLQECKWGGQRFIARFFYGEHLLTPIPFVVSLSNHNPIQRQQRLSSLSFDRLSACPGMLDAGDERKLIESPYISSSSAGGHCQPKMSRKPHQCECITSRQTAFAILFRCP